MTERFARAVEADPGFALGHVGLARARMIGADMVGAREAMRDARKLAEGLPAKQAAHLHTMGLLIDGNAAGAREAVREHVRSHPRDVLIAQLCTSVFGLIGFSGMPGREADQLAYTAALLPHYGDEDWWILSQHAFSLCEVGRLDEASDMIDRSLALRPQNAHAAHVRSHTYYEAGETETGRAYLDAWLPGYSPKGLLHAHLAWHSALWAMEQDDMDRLWQAVDAHIRPSASQAAPIIKLTDAAAILYRAELAGQTVAPERWQEVSRYALDAFPNGGLAFVEFHAALAHAMAGNPEALHAVLENAKGPLAEIVQACGEAFAAITRSAWSEAVAHLTVALADHARLGGSRAQRDLLELSMLHALLKMGRGEEARRLLALRRPVFGDHVPLAAWQRTVLH
ncbi:tetratricopeptide repeat protein [Cognatishimia sp. F0-27]|uniref:tetratricopeptide repeat protein n=1 Tax=Cognatishimia sp. F0-27 TaxID=2816855 RepID=UPI001D0C5BBA|nr:tetratricopeptide repeat protein [Cognatishimia sp. F0-27]